SSFQTRTDGPSGSSICTISFGQRSYSFRGVSAFSDLEYLVAWYRNCILARLPFRIDRAMRTRAAAAAILGMVIVFVLAVAGALIAKSRGPPMEATGPLASSPDLPVTQAHIDRR